MGKDHSKHKDGTPEVNRDFIHRLQQQTGFNEAQIGVLYERYKQLSASKTDDNVIDREEFMGALGITQNPLVERLFVLIDTSGDGLIEFEEFLKAVSIMSNRASQEMKMRFVFRLYDTNDDGFITSDELSMLLSTVLQRYDLNVPGPHVQTIVGATIQRFDGDKDGKLSFEEFCAAVASRSHLLEQLFISSDGLKELEDI